MAKTGAMPAGILVSLVQVLSGQQPTAPAFEVASVKRNNTNEPGRQGALFRENINTTQGSVALRNVTLNSCIKWAYGLQDPQISGPDWITVERYDIVAKSAGPTSEEQLRLMLKSLLAERFKLIAQRETRSLSVVALTVGKNGPKLHESDIGGAGTLRTSRGRIVAQSTSMGELAGVLSDPLRSPVVNATGLTGRYDFTLDFSAFVPEPDQTPDEMTATISVVQQQLGLNLERRKFPTDILVVDHADKIPIEN